MSFKKIKEKLEVKYHSDVKDIEFLIDKKEFNNKNDMIHLLKYGLNQHYKDKNLTFTLISIVIAVISIIFSLNNIQIMFAIILGSLSGVLIILSLIHYILVSISVSKYNKIKRYIYILENNMYINEN